MRIKAAVLRAHDAPHRIEEVELAAPGPGEVLVRIAGAGLCRTDLLPRVPGFPAAPPIVCGHEGAGVVEEVGPEVGRLEPGDHVVLSYDSCRSCADCLWGRPAHCETFFSRNLTGTGVDGPGPMRDERGAPVAARWFGQSSWATHSLVAARNTVKVDRDLPVELLGPLSCGIQTGAGAVLHTFNVTFGSSVIVCGMGSAGLGAVMAARVAGADTIVAVDADPDRLDLARGLGATHGFDGAREDLPALLLEATGGGAQYALDTTGLPSMISIAVHALRPGGTCGLVGAQQGDLVLDSEALTAGRTLTGIVGGDTVPQVFIPQLIRLWRQGRFPFERLITAFPLEEIDRAEEAVLKGEVVKPLLVPAA
ncbi:NAD(P)-dependent alcohol dehydrogenase [Thermomonospora cellulosilytica]|uniref:Aryl-alcohol dehydrogenase n=1 Tax=Thermomonospora cellulosilytica TaxID=1411118 RepID=A0A7W3N1N2_9ACTN|nr:NAD(P)-dependent alcohol dehydrogenase [Thermomonospora cellulosilytica]MBA9005847.1 aryl-alcohol dehydrogenase [Thermomonospora cellulosilytica]